MAEQYQFLLSGLIPSVLVILSWIHNNTRLSRLEAALDANARRIDDANRRLDDTNRRLDDLVRGFHADMMSFQASILEATFQIRERLSVVETNQRS